MENIYPEFQSFNGVGAGQTANISIPAGGPVYGAFYIEHKHGLVQAAATAAEFAANISNIKIKVGGDPLWDITGSNLISLNNFYGYPQVSGYTPIMFARPEFDDPLEKRRFALGTKGVRSLTLEATIAAGVVNPSLRMFGAVVWNEERVPGQLVRVGSTAQSAQAASGEREIHDLPVVDAFGAEPNRGLKALHIKSAVIQSHKVIFNRATISEMPKALNDLVADHQSFSTVGRTPQAGFYHLDFTGNRYSGILPMSGVTDFRLKLNFSAADVAFDIIHEEVIGVPDI